MNLIDPIRARKFRSAPRLAFDGEAARSPWIWAAANNLADRLRLVALMESVIINAVMALAPGSGADLQVWQSMIAEPVRFEAPLLAKAETGVPPTDRLVVAGIQSPLRAAI